MAGGGTYSLAAPRLCRASGGKEEKGSPARYTTGIVYPWVSDVCFGAAPASHTRQQSTPRKHRAPAGSRTAPHRTAAHRTAAPRAAHTGAAPSRSAARSVQSAGSPGTPRPARPWPAGSPRCQESASPSASLPRRIVYQKTRASSKQMRRQITRSAKTKSREAREREHRFPAHVPQKAMLLLRGLAPLRHPGPTRPAAGLQGSAESRLASVRTRGHGGAGHGGKTSAARSGASSPKAKPAWRWEGRAEGWPRKRPAAEPADSFLAAWGGAAPLTSAILFPGVFPLPLFEQELNYQKRSSRGPESADPVSFTVSARARKYSGFPQNRRDTGGEGFAQRFGSPHPTHLRYFLGGEEARRARLKLHGAAGANPLLRSGIPTDLLRSCSSRLLQRERTFLSRIGCGMLCEEGCLQKATFSN